MLLLDTCRSAWDKERNENVAIKKIFNIFEHDREYQKRILREVKILRHFDGCENVVQLYNLILPPSFEEFNDVYIVMEFMDSNLRQMIKSNQELTDQNIQYFLYHLLRGLKTIHSANVLVSSNEFLWNTHFYICISGIEAQRY